MIRMAVGKTGVIMMMRFTMTNSDKGNAYDDTDIIYEKVMMKYVLTRLIKKTIQTKKKDKSSHHK